MPSSRIAGPVLDAPAPPGDARPEQGLGARLETGLTCYDAAYLDVALRAGLPLVTFDERLASAHEAVAKSPPTTT